MHQRTRRLSFMAKPIIGSLAWLVLLPYLTAAALIGQDLAKLDAQQTRSLVDQLAENLNETSDQPTDYIVSKFQDHDIVLFGEIHEIREHCQLVSDLIEPLHKAGVCTLFSEFIPTRFTDSINQITTAKEYDSDAVIEIFRQRPSPLWGFQEYMDIVKAVWKFNQSLEDDQPKFKIIGLENNWSEAELLKADRATRFKMIMAREKHMTNVVRKLGLDTNQKGLVHIGYAHTVQQGIRLAAELENSHPGRVFQVACHHNLGAGQRPSEFTRFIESTIQKQNHRSIGFDVVNSPFANLVDSRSVSFKRLGSKATFKYLAQGYVYLSPIDSLSTVTWVDGFITDQTFEHASLIAKRKRWIGDHKPQSASELNSLIAEHFRKLGR